MPNKSSSIGERECTLRELDVHIFINIYLKYILKIYMYTYHKNCQFLKSKKILCVSYI